MTTTDRPGVTETPPTQPSTTTAKRKVRRIVWGVMVVVFVIAGWFATSIINAVNKDSSRTESLFSNPAVRAPLTGNSSTAPVVPPKQTLAPPNDVNLPQYPAGSYIPADGKFLLFSQRSLIFGHAINVLHIAQCNADIAWLKRAVALGSPEWIFEEKRISRTGPFPCTTGNSIAGVAYNGFSVERIFLAADATHNKFKVSLLTDKALPKVFDLTIVLQDNEWRIEKFVPSA